ncbi:MAG: nucleotidyltransferase [Lactobacillaceae bacterium]|jgi:predicted nucleotidyltransferase|nr:nucleotidyltransferase [Lactobacillaceae bacterium]
MKAVGLITEYNPFHNGHIYHIQKAKVETGADVVVAVMSGNFVQRGIPAVADKWTRAKYALENGVDIVIELPIYFALQPAHIFANGAVKLLNDMGVSQIVFGAENPETDFFNLVENAPEEDGDSNFDEKNQTFASSFAQSLEEATGFKLEGANDILAFSYAKAIVDLGLKDKIDLIPIKRQSAEYHDLELEKDTKIASATAIRKAIDEGTDVSPFTPMTEISNRNYEEKMFELLYYRIATDGVKQLKQVYQMNEGLEYRIKDVVDNGVKSYQELVENVKSKRFTTARIHRILTYTLLNIKVDQMQAAIKEPYLRLLGFTKNGQLYLNEIKKQIDLPFITHVDLKTASKTLRLDYKAGQVYNQIMGHSEPQDVGRIPLNLSEDK